MPTGLRRLQGTGELHFVTFSCFRHRPVLGTGEARDCFLVILEEARAKYRFVVVGYVVMPEHVHLLVSEPEGCGLASAVQVVKAAVFPES